MRENPPHRFRESPVHRGWIGWKSAVEDRGRSWKISGSGAAWYSGLAIWLRVAALKMDAQQWAGIATVGTIRGDAVPEIGPQRPSEIAWRVGRGALDMARRVVGTGAKRPFRGKGSLRKGGVLDRRLRLESLSS